MKREPKSFALLGCVLVRLGADPSVVVATFSDLHTQAAALNRAAAFVEMAGEPRDRVLDDAELRAAIRGHGAPFDSFYLGHDYRASDLHALWRLEDKQGVHLNAEETALRAALLAKERSPPGFAVLIAIPQIGAGIDAREQAAILQHELSHALYFTNASYAAFAHTFWWHTLNAQQRDAMRDFLARGAYDIGNEDLTINEAQAYLINTPDERLFSPDLVPVAEDDVQRWRVAFGATIPAAWKAR